MLIYFNFFFACEKMEAFKSWKENLFVSITRRETSLFQARFCRDNVLRCFGKILQNHEKITARCCQDRRESWQDLVKIMARSC